MRIKPKSEIAADAFVAEHGPGDFVVEAKFIPGERVTVFGDAGVIERVRPGDAGHGVAFIKFDRGFSHPVPFHNVRKLEAK